MEKLDSDDKLLEIHGTMAERDIVQFVEFSKFFNERNDPFAKARLAREVLAEVPRQLITYMASRHFAPKPSQIDEKDLPPDPGSILTKAL